MSLNDNRHQWNKNTASNPTTKKSQ